MNKKELLNLISDVEDDGNVDEILQDTELFKNAQSFEAIKPLFASDEKFKSFLDSEKDTHYAKTLKTWKAKNLEKRGNAEITKRGKGKEETPEQKEIRELRERLDKADKERERMERISKFKDVLAEKNIPAKMINFVVADDDDVTNANITEVAQMFNDFSTDITNKLIKSNKYTPPKGGQSKMTRSEFSKLNILEKQKLYEENPHIYEELSD